MRAIIDCATMNAIRSFELQLLHARHRAHAVAHTCARARARARLAAMSHLCSTDVEVTINQIVRQEPLISENRRPQLRKLLFSTSTGLVPIADKTTLQLSVNALFCVQN